MLRSAKLVGDVDVDAFVDDGPIKRVYGKEYAQRLAVTPEPSGSEVWLKGEESTRPFDSPAALLKFVAGHEGDVRAAYVPDAATGTRWYADKAVWVQDGKELRPFVTAPAARAYTQAHPGARTVSYATALEQAS